MFLHAEILLSTALTGIIITFFRLQGRECQAFLQNLGICPVRIKAHEHGPLETVFGAVEGAEIVLLVESTHLVLSHSRSGKDMPFSIVFLIADAPVERSAFADYRLGILLCPGFVVHIYRRFVSHPGHIGRIMDFVVILVRHFRIMIPVKTAVWIAPGAESAFRSEETPGIVFHPVDAFSIVFRPSLDDIQMAG